MKSLSIWALSVASLMLPLQAMAQAVAVGSDSGVGGDTVVIPVTYTAGGDLAGIDLDVLFDDTQFSAASVSCAPAVNTACAGAFVGCDIDPAGTANLILAAGSACVTGTLGEITLTIDAAATAGDKALMVTVVGASDTGGIDIDPASVGATDGVVTVLGAAYSSNPAPGQITLGAKQNDANPSQDVMISNVGVAGTTLTGTCSLDIGSDSELSLSGDTSFSVMQGAAADTVTVTCDATATIGQYTGQMSCDHNGDSTGEANPALYPVTCNILDKDPAVFASDPDAGSITDMTDGLDVVAGGSVPPSQLVFTNTADAGAHPLNISCLPAAGSSAISSAPDLSGGISIDPGASSVPMTFFCDATNAGPFDATSFCRYTVDGTQPADDNGTAAAYHYFCLVREPEATVVPLPPDGAILTELAQPGGSVDYNVIFSEVGGEGVAGTLDSCSLDTGIAFDITSPLVFPQVISADGSETVTVTGTDPGGVDTVSDTLVCTYTDGDGLLPTLVTYTLVMDIGGNGTFLVTKTFSDDSPGSVDVTLSCNTGLPLTQTRAISEGDPVAFVVTSYESGLMECSVTEEPNSGYSPLYLATGESDNSESDPAEGCRFIDIAGGATNACLITNTPDPVAVVIEKEWIFAGASQGGTSPYYVLTLYCDSRIVGGEMDYYEADSANGLSDIWFIKYDSYGSDTFTAMVVPDYPSSSCWVDESIIDDTVEIENGCLDIEVSVNNGDSCKITNTVFYEGIPTLNQYGLAILALLMLGVGMVGFRRFA